MTACSKCGSLRQEKALLVGTCFACDPTAEEVKEFNIMLRLVEAAAELSDFNQIERVFAWAACRARNDLEERLHEVLTARAPVMTSNSTNEVH